jgi:hypothetical protein
VTVKMVGVGQSVFPTRLGMDSVGQMLLTSSMVS